MTVVMTVVMVVIAAATAAVVIVVTAAAAVAVAAVGAQMRTTVITAMHTRQVPLTTHRLMTKNMRFSVSLLLSSMPLKTESATANCCLNLVLVVVGKR